MFKGCQFLIFFNFQFENKGRSSGIARAGLSRGCIEHLNEIGVRTSEASDGSW